MTATDGIVHYDVTRIALIDALAALPLGGYLTLEARGRFADCILGQLPEARGEAEIRAEERERIAELAAKWEQESDAVREQSVRDGLHPALAGAHREANLLMQRAADLRAVLSEEP